MDSDKILVPTSRRTHAEIISILRAHRESQLTVAEFCERHGVNKGTFNTWKKRHGKTDRTENDSSSFVRLSVTTADFSQTLFAEVNGIRLYQPVSAEFLKSLRS